jgi:hypothetical protein
MSFYSVRFYYNKPVLHIMELGTNALLFELNYVSEQRKQLCYGLPVLQPNCYVMACRCYNQTVILWPAGATTKQLYYGLPGLQPNSYIMACRSYNQTVMLWPAGATTKQLCYGLPGLQPNGYVMVCRGYNQNIPLRRLDTRRHFLL